MTTEIRFFALKIVKEKVLDRGQSGFFTEDKDNNNNNNSNTAEIFYGDQKPHKYFSFLRIRGTSLLTCSYIGKLRNGRKFNCENEPLLTVFI